MLRGGCTVFCKEFVEILRVASWRELRLPEKAGLYSVKKQRARVHFVFQSKEREVGVRL